MHTFFRRLVSAPMAFVAGIVIATAATASAAVLITGSDIKDGSVTGVDLRDGSVGSRDLKDGSILRRDLSSTVRAQLDLAGQPGPKGDPGDPGPKGDKGDKGDTGADGSPDTAAQVLSKLTTVDGSGSGVDADTLDGVDSAQLARFSRTNQINQTSPMAAGANEYWFTFGYSQNDTIVWEVVPAVVGAKMRLEVEAERGASNTLTYYLRVFNTGTIASGYVVRRSHLNP